MQDSKRQRSDSKISLDVGGSIFCTTLSTLRRYDGSFFSGICSGHFDLSNSFFIDRDPFGFEYVLNFMRGSVLQIPDNKALIDKLVDDIDYYQLPQMLQCVHPEMARRRVCFLAGGDIKATEDEIRTRMIETNGERRFQGMHDGDRILIDPFDPYEHTQFSYDSSLPVQCTLLFGEEQRAMRYKNLGGTVERSLEDFYENWSALTHSAFLHFDWNGVVAAGGAVLACLLPTPAWIHLEKNSQFACRDLYFNHNNTNMLSKLTMEDESLHGHDEIWIREGSKNLQFMERFNSGGNVSDIDLFFVGLDEQEALKKLRYIEKQLRKKWIKLIVVRTSSAVTFASEWPHRRVQVVLRLHESISHILFSFDIDACCVAFNGERLYVTPRAKRAINWGINVVDPDRCSPTYEDRLYKYAMVKGFAVAMPNIDMSGVDMSIFQADPSTLRGFAKLLRFQTYIKTQRIETFSICSEFSISGFLRAPTNGQELFGSYGSGEESVQIFLYEKYSSSKVQIMMQRIDAITKKYANSQKPLPYLAGSKLAHVMDFHDQGMLAKNSTEEVVSVSDKLKRVFMRPFDQFGMQNNWFGMVFGIE